MEDFGNILTFLLGVIGIIWWLSTFKKGKTLEDKRKEGNQSPDRIKPFAKPPPDQDGGELTEKLPEHIQQNTYKADPQEYLDMRQKRPVIDQQLSHEDENELSELSMRLGLPMPTAGNRHAVLNEYRLMWRFSQGDPPSIPADITLRKGEVCYFASPVKWNEMRRVTKRIQYAGPRMKIKIYKNIHWRMGDMAVRRVAHDQLTLIDDGIMYLTNKRLIFSGKMKNFTIPTAKIFDFELFADGIKIDRETGKSPFLEFSDNNHLFAAALARALHDGK